MKSPFTLGRKGKLAFKPSSQLLHPCRLPPSQHGPHPPSLHCQGRSMLSNSKCSVTCLAVGAVTLQYGWLLEGIGICASSTLCLSFLKARILA